LKTHVKAKDIGGVPPSGATGSPIRLYAYFFCGHSEPCAEIMAHACMKAIVSAYGEKQHEQKRHVFDVLRMRF